MHYLHLKHFCLIFCGFVFLNVAIEHGKIHGQYAYLKDSYYIIVINNKVEHALISTLYIQYDELKDLYIAEGLT